MAAPPAHNAHPLWHIPKAEQELRRLSDLYSQSQTKVPDYLLEKKEELIDRIKGIIWGNAIGDAIGLATENFTKSGAELTYAKIITETGTLQFSDIPRDGHRSKWAQGDWTDDTDQMLCILHSLLACHGQVQDVDVAKRIAHWASHGFPELGDEMGRGIGIGITVGSVVNHPQFTQKPKEAGYDVWVSKEKNFAANGGAMRTSILAIPHFWNINQVAEQTADICRITHYDGRSVSSAVALDVAIALLLQHETDPQLIAKAAATKATEFLVAKHPDTNQEDEDTGRRKAELLAEFQKYINANSLTELNLDDLPTRGYTLKALGAAFFLFRTCNDFRKGMIDLLMEGGDADTNCASAGALLGAKVGFARLPTEWTSSLLESDYLRVHINRLLCLLNLQTPSEGLKELELIRAQSKGLPPRLDATAELERSMRAQKLTPIASSSSTSSSPSQAPASASVGPPPSPSASILGGSRSIDPLSSSNGGEESASAGVLQWLAMGGVLLAAVIAGAYITTLKKK